MVFRSFAVIGYGKIGSFIITELLRLKTAGTVSSVTIVSRSDVEGSYPEWVAQGAKFAIIDYSDQQTLLEAFKDVEVVISAVNSSREAVESQRALADAAKAAGARVFVPSEFGGIALVPTAPLKVKIHEYLKEIGLPSVVFYTGACIDLVLSPASGFDFANGKVTVRGIGDAPISFLTGADMARYVGFIFTNLPAEKFEWKVLRLEADLMSFNEILELYQGETGKPLEITHISPSELEKRSDTASIIALRRDMGGGMVGEPLNNDLYPGWNPKRVMEAIL